MEALIAIIALVSFGLLAMRFGADSRPTIRSDEHRLALAGMVWDAGARPTSPAADTLPSPRWQTIHWSGTWSGHRHLLLPRDIQHPRSRPS